MATPKVPFPSLNPFPQQSIQRSCGPMSETVDRILAGYLQSLLVQGEIAPQFELPEEVSL